MASRSRNVHTTRRSLLAACLVLLALGAVVVAVTAHGPDEVTAGSAPSATQAARAAPPVQARSGTVIDRRSGKVLWSKNAGLRLAPASCTKIMTALLVLEHYRDLDRMVRAPASVTEHQTVAIGLRPGDRISVLQALRATMTKSANDACITLAVAVGGSEARFVRLMNRRAAQLGLTHKRFVNSRGAPTPGHYSCARDLAKLGRYAMRDADSSDGTVDQENAGDPRGLEQHDVQASGLGKPPQFEIEDKHQNQAKPEDWRGDTHQAQQPTKLVNGTVPVDRRQNTQRDPYADSKQDGEGRQLERGREVSEDVPHTGRLVWNETPRSPRLRRATYGPNWT